MLELSYLRGTLELRGPAAHDLQLPEWLLWDPRSLCYRAPALHYAALVRALLAQSAPFQDTARRYAELEQGLQVRREPRDYQQAGLQGWLKAKGRGVVVLPTGSGKSYLALMAIDAKRRDTLVVAPTLDLVRQWYDLLRHAFCADVGVLGGGEHRVLPLTVCTYDSAYLHMEHLGARFGLLVFDECHHLPGSTYSLAARLSLAPFRLGLTATPERADGREDALDELVGPVAYRRDIGELAGEYLAEYTTERIIVQLSPQERAEHDQERALYREFVRSQGIRMGSPAGWGDFVMRSSMSDEGRRAMRAYRRQRQIAFAAQAKIDTVEYLLRLHAEDRCLLFTNDNATAYELSHRFLLPAITHQTRISERSEILSGLRAGRYGAVVTSKVLNEGVDVPEANVAIVISGSGSVREHVQRLGRILRKQADKTALLYELVAADTAETYTSSRRREHGAYR